METQTDPALQAELVVPEPLPPEELHPRWGFGLKLIFRLAFIYFTLYCLPFPLAVLPFTEKAGEWWEAPWHKIVPWVAQHALRLAQPITVFTNGSGDTTYDYVKVFCFLMIALLGAVIWSVLDRRRGNYQRLHEWLRLYVRLTLGSILLSYGAFKVIPSQFPPPWQWRYLETYGDSSPMGILWTFMGASKMYTIFAGAVEMLGGILLFVPRLTTLGALVTIGAMGNVFLLNMSYDVPVKLYSFHLLVMSILLALPDLKRMASFFVFNRAPAPAPSELVFRRRGIALGALIAQLALGVWFFGADLYQSHKSLKSFMTDSMLSPPLFGTWLVDDFSLDGQTRPPLTTDDVRWQRAIFEFKGSLAVQGMDGKILRMTGKFDTDKKTIELTKRSDPTWKANVSYNVPAKDTMMIDGDAAGKRIHVKLHRTDPQYLLKTRGFHWINEFPFNR